MILAMAVVILNVAKVIAGMKRLRAVSQMILVQVTAQVTAQVTVQVMVLETVLAVFSQEPEHDILELSKQCNEKTP
jgi:hypothetical protein